MIYLRAAIITILALIVILIGYIFFTFDSSYELNLALEAFQKGDYVQVDSELKKLTNAFPKDQLRLYEAYLNRAQNHLIRSNELLKESALAGERSSKKSLLLEIYLNQAFNAYLMDDQVLFLESLKKSTEINPKNPWIQFFSILGNFCKGNYQEAKDLWQKNYPKEALSGWMKKSFDEKFSPLWFSLQMVHCKIEEGNYLSGRQILKNLSEDASQTDLNEIHLLMGFSYLKEAQSKPFNAALPYYQLAFSYFDQVPMQQEQYGDERQKISSQLLKVVQGLLQEQSYNDLTFYISLLEKWRASAELETIYLSLLQAVDEDIKQNNWHHVQEMTNLLGMTLPAGEVRQGLSKRFELLTEKVLNEDDFEHAALLWEAALALSSTPKSLSEKFADEIERKIINLIPGDDPFLSKTSHYLTLWMIVEKDNQKRFLFANQLVLISAGLWLADGQEQKALNTMKAASSIPLLTEKKELQEIIGKLIQKIYLDSAEQDNVAKLPLLLEAVRLLNLSNVNLHDKKAIANYQADANYLYSQKRYSDAKKIADWLLQLNPNDQEARSISARVAYYFADYSQSLDHFSHLTHFNPQTLESFAVSQVLAGNPQTGLKIIQEQESKHLLGQDAILRLGLGLLAKGQFAEGTQWLKKIESPSNEVYAGLCFSLYQLQDWEAAIHDFHQLTPPYSLLDGIRGVNILSLVEQKKEDLAEEFLHALLNSPQEPVDSLFSPPFLQFKKKQLDTFDRKHVSDLFYQQTKRKGA